MEPKTLKIDDVEYIRKDSIRGKEPSGDIKIVILQRGWNIVGIFNRKGDSCTLSRASVIRQWGTTKGLGEIAAGGPTSKTVLDKCNGLVEFDALTVVAMISVEADKWRGAL